MQRLAATVGPAVLVSLVVLCCAGETPRQVAMRDDIAAGPYTLSIVGARDAPNPPPPLSSFREEPGKQCVIAFVYWKTRRDGIGRVELIEFLRSQLSISDSRGRRTRASSAFFEKLMYLEDPGGNWWDLVVVFRVPEDSRDLTLLVQNPEPREGQARVTAIPLGL